MQYGVVRQVGKLVGGGYRIWKVGTVMQQTE